MEISGRALTDWYYMGLGGLWWSSVLNSALSPWRLRPNSSSEQQDPVYHTAFNLAISLVGIFPWRYTTTDTESNEDSRLVEGPESRKKAEATKNIACTKRTQRPAASRWFLILDLELKFGILIYLSTSKCTTSSPIHSFFVHKVADKSPWNRNPIIWFPRSLRIKTKILV